ncbi:MAG: aminomethyltransferase family protein [Candidatus Pelagadaptatus aseana]|uniref:aminomethyltransferase family protein n=1 Tax=Candidatus Pelagadaptatus aseana TaxID=3120508 RepID=UPI0039B13AA9
MNVKTTHTTPGLLKSPFYPRLAPFNEAEQWGDWNGYANALFYKDAYTEYFTTRNSCGVYDVSPMCKYRIRGDDAEAMLNRMVTRDVSKQGINKVAYNVWCDDRGKVIDDGTIFRFAQNDFILMCAEPALDWLMLACEGFTAISVHEETEEIAGLALQGPTSCALLKALQLAGVENLTPFEIGQFAFPADNPVTQLTISRTGFTGDLGYELWIAPEHALLLWDQLFARGEPYGLHPYGEESLDMARIEAGFILPEVEFHGALHTVNLDHDHSPFELSLDWMVNLKKPHFNGREALIKEKQQGSPWRLLKLDIPGEKVAENAILYAEKICKTEIGYVTSALNSPVTKANIALAMVKGSHIDKDIFAEIYYQKELRWNRKVRKCTVQQKPFWWPDRGRATPPADY